MSLTSRFRQPVTLRHGWRSLSENTTPDWDLHCRTAEAGLDALVTRDFSQAGQELEMYVLTRLQRFVVLAWRKRGGEPRLTLAEHVATRDDVVNARWHLLSDAIQISDTYDGAVYLLCPTVIDEEAEWEAWLFATWVPGAARFTSWWDLLNEEYRTWQAR